MLHKFAIGMVIGMIRLLYDVITAAIVLINQSISIPIAAIITWVSYCYALLCYVDPMEELKFELDIVQNTRKRLATLDLYVLDNSIRETTVGQPLCHTLRDKINIYNEVKKIGIKDMIVGSFSHHHQVDDDFVQYLRDENVDFSGFFAFSEIADINDGIYDSSAIPIQLQKIQKYGIPNPLFEVDLAGNKIDWDNKVTVNDICQILSKLMMWTYANVCSTSRIIINIRDYPKVMKEAPGRFFDVLKFLSKLPMDQCPWGLAIEDATGDVMPDELASWIKVTRTTMTKNGWKSGKLIVHVHQKFDLHTAAQLKCLAAGADGVWAGLSEDGAVNGHASSSVTMINLFRLNNTKVSQQYNIKQLKNAVNTITRISTGKDPPCNQAIFGRKAGDIVIEDIGFGEISISNIFGEDYNIRLCPSTATPNLVSSQLRKYFGDNAQFNNTELVEEMIRLMHEDLCSNVKKDYNDKDELANLFMRAGGTMEHASYTELVAIVII